MATAIYRHEGDRVDYTPSSDVSAGDVIALSTMFGIATQDIASGDKDSLAIEGVFAMPKATGASEGIDQGDTVYWDSSAEQATEESSGNSYLGKCAADAADADSTVDVLINVNE